MLLENIYQSLRSLSRRKGFTLLNFTGLYVSLSVSLLIGLMIFHERSFDGFHRDAAHIFRVVCSMSGPAEEEKLAVCPGPLPAALREEVPEIRDFTVMQWNPEQDFQFGAQIIREKDVIFADSAFFDVFNFKTQAGNAAALLRQPGKVLLTESTAARLFPGGNALGKTFSISQQGEKTTLEVAGIMEDAPANSHLRFSMLVSFPTLKLNPESLTNWGWFSGGRFVYLRLPAAYPQARVGERLSEIANARKNKADDSQYKYGLQPLADIHAGLDYARDNSVYTVDFQYFYWLGAIALFLILVACINYVNLSTAIAARKAKEIGVRKTLGAGRSQLAFQFLGETFLLTLGAVILAACTTHLLLPELNVFLDRQIVADWFSVNMIGFLTGLCVLTTLLAGLYPAFILAGFRPAEALRSRFNAARSRSSLTLRRSLVAFQFAVAQVFIAAVIISALQIQYLRSKPLGFRQNNVVDIRLPDGKPEQISTLKSQLAGVPGIKKASLSIGAPVAKWSGFGTRFNLRENYEQNKLDVNVKVCDPDYLETYGVELIAGRFIDENDQKQVAENIPEKERRYVMVVNESAVKALGFSSPEAVLGREVTIGIDYVSPPIVGVVRDFHTSSLHEKVGPVALMPYAGFKNNLGLLLDPGAANAGTLAAVEKIWKSVYPDALFESAFLDEHIASLYGSERRTFRLFQFVALLALLINALGLVGLTAFMVEQKTKEIGVRKVLGASVYSITSLLTRDFLKLVLLALVVATPVAWWVMNKWLADFAYRIDIHWWVFALVGLSAVLIAFLTVGFQSVKAALANPVKSLRSE